MTAKSGMCELCGLPSEMEFNIVVPSRLGKPVLIKGDICLACYSKYPTDITLAVALFVRDMEKEKETNNDSAV